LEEKSKWVKLAVQCVRLCLKCLHKCIKYISTMAYIMVVMEGTTFCQGAIKATQLIWYYTSTLSTVTAISAIVVALAKLSLVIFSTFVFYLCVSMDAMLPSLGTMGLTRPELSSPWLPLAVNAVLAYGIASSYFEVLSMSIQTILVSYCADRELNDKTQMWAMTKELRDYFMTEDELAHGAIRTAAAALEASKPEESSPGINHPDHPNKTGQAIGCPASSIKLLQPDSDHQRSHRVLV